RCGEPLADHPGPGPAHRRPDRKPRPPRRTRGETGSVSVIANIADLQERARRRLPKAVFDYVHGGAYDELTLARNRADLDALAIDQRVMRDVSQLATATTMIGDKAAIPLAVGPAGMAGLTWPNGEVETAKAAVAFGVPY